MERIAPDQERDCCFDEAGQWFRYRAAAIIQHGDSVLMARNDIDPYHYSIGGGVHHGETAEDAVRREVHEETGVDMAVERLAFVHENFFAGPEGSLLSGRQCHELTFYFLMRYQPGLVLSHGSIQNGVREWAEWVEIPRLGKERPAYPVFFATDLPFESLVPHWRTTRDG